MLFDALMVSMGYLVLRPLSMSCVYDRVVDIDGKFVRFQIKSVNTDVSDKTWIKVRTTKANDTSYSKQDVDLFAIYIRTFNSWYFQYNRGKSVVFVSFRNLNNFAQCLDIKDLRP